ncbi:MAG: bifunctional phosphopantothenoylcysteine decarboxylase/phosphopantothenate--cysteine ligase CoaBC [Thermoleophilia bacterium]
MNPTAKQIVLGVTGSIAAYKAVELLRLLTGAGHDVRVVQTGASRSFVGPLTFEALSGHPVLTEQFAAGQDSAIPHIDLAQCDLMLIAPATANTIGKMAAGLADNLLLSTCLTVSGPVVLCPAMNERMWRHPAVKENIATLQRRGVTVISPPAGPLACGDEGEGRLAAPAEIFRQVEEILRERDRQDFAGKRILVTAGATREPIDTVRFISNRSSGRMGFAVARAARRRGAEVTLIAANCSLERDPGVRYIDVSTSGELAAALDREFEHNDVLVMAAAVADYKVSSVRTTGKLDRKQEKGLQLLPAIDIISTLNGGSGGKLKVGFAAEHGQENIERARMKLRDKKLDMIVFNDISRCDIGLETIENEIVIMAPGREDVFVSKTTKLACADRILDELKKDLSF